MSSLQRIIALLLILQLTADLKSFGQWKNSYGNEWINYSQPYVRIGVSNSGIQRVKLDSLPSSFPKSDPGRFQLWFRGKEVSIISASSSEIVFYGVTNNGASDSLVFRPETDRLNPHVSLFSEEGSYFLTVSSTVKRAKVIDGTALSGETERFHLQKMIKKFDVYNYNSTQKGYTRELGTSSQPQQQFSFSTYVDVSDLNNSYYTKSNAWVGETFFGPGVTVKEKDPKDPTNFINVPRLPKSYNNIVLLKNWLKAEAPAPVFEILVNGLHTGSHNVGVYVSPNSEDVETVSKLVTTMTFNGFGGEKRTTQLKEGVNVSDSGQFNLRVLSRNTESSTDWIGVSYYSVTYPQLTDMSGETSMVFNFSPSSQSSSRIRIANAPSDAKIYDISNERDPVEITGKVVSGGLEAMVGRVSKEALTLLVVSSSAIRDFTKANIHSVNFLPMYSSPVFGDKAKEIPTSSYDYLVITHSGLKDVAVEYAQYRSGSEGGANKTLLMDIRDVYDQFNFGEPSPIAIRRFVNYMLKDGVRPEKHNLLLLGHSVTLPVRIIRELPGEVPTFGDPGSDILLVAGLQGTHQDVPAIPVGRVGALNSQDLRNYLEKVKSYEHSTDVSWRKNVLHLSGGQSTYEVTQLKSILSNLIPEVENGELGGIVETRVKQNPLGGEVEKVDITDEINRGAGMLSYFGHGAQNITDLDMGFITDVSRKYNNKDKYPLMFFNGCGVGNIFTGRTVYGLSGNWLLTGGLGAGAIIANSYKSYISTSEKHLKVLYDQLFVVEKQKTIGQIIRDVASQMVKEGLDSYDVANLHQVYIHGDPFLKMPRVEYPDYSVDPNESIKLYSENANIKLKDSKVINLSVVISNGGRYAKNEKIPLYLRYIFKEGGEEVVTKEIVSIPYRDTLVFSIPNTKTLSRIEVKIDRNGILKELTKSNNNSELTVDWDEARELTSYPVGNYLDLVPPIINIYANDRVVDKSTVLVNPVIRFELSDNYSVKNDSTAVEILLAKCEDANCDFKKVSYLTENLKISSTSSRELVVEYTSSKLSAGNYKLMVTGTDASGNSIRTPFKISFVVAEAQVGDFKVIASPNPATSFIRFQTSLYDPKSFKSMEFLIYNSKGVLVHTQNIPSHLSGIGEWLWYPNKLPSGVYYFKVNLNDSEGKRMQSTGKVILI